MSEEKATQETTREYIYRVLKDDIIYLKLEPGVIISENDISKRFNVSRTPVRDVFSKLQIDNLVEVKPQRGTFVSLIDLDYVRDIIFMRNCVETEIYSELAAGITEDQLQSLKENLIRQKQTIEAISLGAPELDYFKIDSEFHKLAYGYVRRARLWEVIQQLKVHYTRFRMLDLVETKDFETLYHEHCAMVDILEKRDRKRMSAIMEEHLYGGINRLGDKIKDKYRSYFLA